MANNKPSRRNSNDAIIIGSIALANLLAQMAAVYMDQARLAGATPEQIAASRDAAVAHFDKSAAAVAADEPLIFKPPQA